MLLDSIMANVMLCCEVLVCMCMCNKVIVSKNHLHRRNLCKKRRLHSETVTIVAVCPKNIDLETPEQDMFARKQSTSVCNVQVQKVAVRHYEFV